MTGTVIYCYHGECCSRTHMASVTAEGRDRETMARDVVKRAHKRRQQVEDVCFVNGRGKVAEWFDPRQLVPRRRGLR